MLKIVISGSFVLVLFHLLGFQLGFQFPPVSVVCCIYLPRSSFKCAKAAHMCPLAVSIAFLVSQFSSLHLCLLFLQVFAVHLVSSDPKLVSSFPKLVSSVPKLVVGFPKLVSSDPNLISSVPKLVSSVPKLVVGFPKLVSSVPKLVVGVPSMSAVYCRCPLCLAVRQAGVYTDPHPPDLHFHPVAQLPITCKICKNSKVPDPPLPIFPPLTFFFLFQAAADTG